MGNSEVIIGLDIGTTKICCIVGRMNEFGKLEILSLGKAKSTGVNRGVVVNINKTVEAIREAVEHAQQNYDGPIEEVHVGIAGQHINCYQNDGILTRGNTDSEITRHDLDRLADDMQKLSLEPGERIIDVIPQEYTVDNEGDIKDPVGIVGNRIQGRYHIITGQMSAIKNIHKCVEKAGLKVKNLVLEPIASASEAVTRTPYSV